MASLEMILVIYKGRGTNRWSNTERVKEERTMLLQKLKICWDKAMKTPSTWTQMISIRCSTWSFRHFKLRRWMMMEVRLSIGPAKSTTTRFRIWDRCKRTFCHFTWSPRKSSRDIKDASLSFWKKTRMTSLDNSPASSTKAQKVSKVTAIC